MVATVQGQARREATGSPTSMTTLPFYTDALAAAWMHKHFGMRHCFLDERGELREYEVPITGEDDAWRAGVDGRFYVHAESLRLLEPRINDIVEVHDNTGFHIPRRLHDVYDTQCLGCEWTFHRIIQRNGKAFHSPESETA